MNTEGRVADLTYNICSMRITGMLDGARIEIVAFSGGRAGSKTSGAVNPVLANNPFLTSHRLDSKDKGSIGGALPQGMYTLLPHESRANWIRLVPSGRNLMYDRGGFAIHGRGHRGSDGCLVPPDFKDVLKMYEIVKKRKEAHQAPLTLKVIAVGNLDDFSRFARMA